MQKYDTPWYRGKLFLLAIVAAVALLLFPPWRQWINTASIRKEQPAGHAFLLTPPKAPSSNWSTSVSVTQLCMELLAIAGATAILVLLFTKRRPFEPHPQLVLPFEGDLTDEMQEAIELGLIEEDIVRLGLAAKHQATVARN